MGGRPLLTSHVAWAPCPRTRPHLEDAIQAALATVDDPEIRRPITDLGMVKGFTVADRPVTVELLLTVAGCPLRDKLTTDITAALTTIPGIDRGGDRLRRDERGAAQGAADHAARWCAPREPVIPFAQPGSRTRVYAVASGKGGVGKSSVTVNLAAALARRGPVGRRGRRRHLRPLGAPDARRATAGRPGSKT